MAAFFYVDLYQVSPSIMVIIKITIQRTQCFRVR